MGSALERARRVVDIYTLERLQYAERLVDSGVYNYYEARIIAGLDELPTKEKITKNSQKSINVRGRLAVDAALNKNNS